MQIKEIQTRSEIMQTFEVLQQIYENLDKNSYLEHVLDMMENGYKMAGVFEDQMVENGRCIGVVGIKVGHKIQYGKILEIQDFMIDRKKRGIGVGKMLLRWVDWQATTFKCHNIIGALETKRKESQQIFSREKFILDGFLFRKSF